MTARAIHDVARIGGISPRCRRPRKRAIQYTLNLRFIPAYPMSAAEYWVRRFRGGRHGESWSQNYKVSTPWDHVWGRFRCAPTGLQSTKPTLYFVIRLSISNSWVVEPPSSLAPTRREACVGHPVRNAANVVID